MSNIINKIQLSGITYDIGGQGGSGVSIVEVTQAEYDALPTSAKTDTSKMYVITDAEAVDLTNYYTKSETNTLLGGKADTATTYTKTEVDNAITAATSTKQDTLVSSVNIKTINNESLLGSGNIDIQGGGGKAIEAGRGITITTGETADTVSFNLPISAGTGDYSIKCGKTDAASGTYSFAIGANGVKANGQCSFAGGSYSEAKGFSSMAFGRYSIANNYGEVALGFFNKSNGSSSAAGNSSGNTLFSVGNGTNSTSTTRHNAFEIRQNGDIYCSDGTNDVKLQDTITATASNTTALGGLKLVKLTQSEYDALATKDSNTLYVING